MNCRKKQPQKNAMDNYKIDQVRTSRIKVDYNKSAEGYGILNLKAIDRDFDLFVLNYEGDTIYKSKRQASYIKALGILETANPVSISHLYGQRAALLFPKGKDSGSLIKKLYEADPDSDMKLMHIDIFKNGVPVDNEDILGKYNIHLIRAIYNLMGRTNSSLNSSYSNMEGHLYYTTSELAYVYDKSLSLHCRVALEVIINEDMILELRVVTFIEYTKEEALNRRRNPRTHKLAPLYMVETGTGKIHRIRKKDIGETAYLKGNFEGKKSTISFCSWESLDKSAKTKCGILYRSFMKELKEHLSNYITLEFETTPYYQLKEELKLKNMNAKERTERYVSLAKNLGILKFYICNLVGELGIDTADELAGYLTQYGFEIEHCIQKPEEIKEGTEFAIILIHSKKAYAEMKRINKNVKDAYTGADFSVQHMVIPYLEDEKKQKTKGKKKKKSATDEEESSRNVDQNVFLKLLAEAIIKTDLLNETISLVDMTEFIGDSEDSEMTVQWITRKKQDNKKKTSKATQNASEAPSDSEMTQETDTNTTEKEKPIFWCPQITVLSDGTIDRYFSFDDETSDKKKEGFKNLREEEEKRGRVMQCVIGINGNKYVVSRTEEVFLPKEGLNDQLVKEEGAVCSVSDFQNYLKKFYKQTHCDDYYNAVLKKLDTFLSTQNKSDCNKGDLRSLCKNSKCKEDERAMLKFLHTNGIDTVSHKKDKETKKINGLDAFDYVHFRIIEEPVSELNPNIKEPVLQYVVGELALNQSLARALHVYTIRYVPDEDDIDKQVSADTKKAQMFIIFRMTDVFFVRENEFTVVPFICKYAREWERVIWSDHFEEEVNQEQENDTEDETIDLSNEPDEEGESVF